MSREELIKSTKRGILVTRFWYIRSVDPQTLLYTGLTRDGTFYIENGEIKYPVKNFRFNESPIVMLNNIESLGKPVRIDGNMIPRDLTLPAETVIKGDARSQSISAASIAAKICRDCVMLSLAQQHPGYGWETNAGYPSKSHRLALQNLGVTPHHRRSFKPVHHILYQAKTISD